VRGAGTDRVNLAWNAYYDSGWKFITGGERAMRIALDDGAIHLEVSRGTGSADTAISWDGFTFDGAGIRESQNGPQLYDDAANVFPQGRLGGPASSLSSYPIPAGDVADGSGSGLNADLLDGKHASEIGGSGEWSVISTTTETNDTSPINVSTGSLSTTYDQYEIDIVHEAADGDLSTGEYQQVYCEIQNDASSNYETTYIDKDTGVQEQTTTSRWVNVAKLQAPQEVGQATVRIQSDVTGTKSEKRHPSITRVNTGGNWESQHLVSGTFKKDVPTVDEIRFYTEKDATGVVRVKGRDF